MTERLLAGGSVSPGQHVLELACGPGGAGLAAAEVVGDRGHVIVSDVVPEMAAIAATRATSRGLRNVTAATLDLEAIDQPDAAFDVVVCREGLMFAVDPARALTEIHRVLRPGGRLALSVWGPREANPWLGVVVDAVAAVIGMVVPPPGMPGPFALADQTELASLLVAAGFLDVTVDAVAVPLRSPTFEAWWARTAAVAGPVATIIARLDETKRAEMERQLRSATARYATDEGLEFPGLAIVVCGQGP
jgi:SAM-dependent methyltransferase